MEPAEYQGFVRHEAANLRKAAVAAGPEASVPTCPGWTVYRLVQHVDRVFDMVIRIVRAADPATPPERRPPTGGDFDELLTHFDDTLAAMLDLLASTDPTTPAWTFSPTAPRTVGFWSRRQAHEVTMHRIDAEAAAGVSTPVESAFAADGVDEVLTRLIQRNPDRWTTAQLAGSVLYHAPDAGRSWTVRLVPGQLPQTAPESAVEPDASVVGLADALYRAAWGRPSRAVISGDLGLVGATRAS